MHQKVNEAVKITIHIFQPVITILHDVQDIFQLSTHKRQKSRFSTTPFAKKHRRGVCVCHFPNTSPSVHKALSALSIHFYCIKNYRRKAKFWESLSICQAREREGAVFRDK